MAQICMVTKADNMKELGVDSLDHGDSIKMNGFRWNLTVFLPIDLNALSAVINLLHHSFQFRADEAACPHFSLVYNALKAWIATGFQISTSVLFHS